MPRPAVFIDRDGTIIEEKVYLADPAKITVIPGVFEALRSLRDAGFVLVTVTNQAGIARGYYTEDDYHAVAARLNEILGEEDVEVDDTVYCPHHPDHGGPCDCRKPATGMYVESAGRLDIDPRRSFYVGDKITDVLPAAALGGQGILVRTGYGRELESEAPEGVWVVDDLLAAAECILKGAEA